MLKILAFDYGASSGRGIIGSYNGDKLDLKEVHRFSNDPVRIRENFYWDILRLYHEMKQGIIKCVKEGNKDISSIGVDTWGVDFGLLDENGDLLGNPYHYRDARTDGMIEEAAALVSKDEIYARTGIAFQKFNSLYQLLAMKKKKPDFLEKARTLLFTPDLLNYFLTGMKAAEYTIASTSQMLNARTCSWDNELLDRLGIPTGILTEIIKPCTVLGTVRESIMNELGIPGVPVIAVAEHDTASAVASVPSVNGKYAYISSGTWSLMGIESEIPLINETAYRFNYTNEGGINNSIRLLKNIMGLWIYQECKRYWDKSGEVLSFDELEELSEKSRPFKCFIDPDNEMFFAPGDMPNKVAGFCRDTNQEIPETKGEIVRCVMESLALEYRMVLEGLEEMTGCSLPVIHVVGGGSRNIILNKFTANATGRPVLTGPVEATAVGNIISQLIALGEVKNIQEARTLVGRSFQVNKYLPSGKDIWDDAYARFVKIV